MCGRVQTPRIVSKHNMDVFGTILASICRENAQKQLLLAPSGARAVAARRAGCGVGKIELVFFYFELGRTATRVAQHDQGLQFAFFSSTKFAKLRSNVNTFYPLFCTHFLRHFAMSSDWRTLRSWFSTTRRS